ncbi:MAG: PIN domain-containing protein [Promethearchaeota archaeon]
MSPKNIHYENLVIIDSNFIFLPFQFKINYLENINSRLEGRTKFIVYRQIFDELEAKKEREPKATKFYKQLESGLIYLDKNKNQYNIEIDDSIKDQIETTDEFLLRKATELKEERSNIFLASNDQDLRKKARNAKIGVIFLRQKKYLSIDRS